MGNEGLTTLARILVVEDDAELRELYERRFDSLGGFDCTGAEIGMKGLDLIDDTYSLVILDWHLPDTTGRDVLNQLKEEYPDIPVVVVTGQSYPDDVDDLPCTEYLVKPTTQEEWREILHNLDLME